MKKYLAAFVMMAMMAVMVPLMATDASAQTYRTRTSERYYEEDDKNIYDKHRNVINIGIGAGAGATSSACPWATRSTAANRAGTRSATG